MRKRLKKFLEEFKFWLLLLTGVGIAIDIFFFAPTWNLVILFLTGLWLLSAWLYKFEGEVSVAGGLIFLLFCPFLLILERELMAEKMAAWAFMFLVVGVIQEFIEYIKEKKSEIETP